MHFDKVARFAALEVMLRGPGVRGEYDYSLSDCITVAWIYDISNSPTDKSFSNVQQRKVQVLNLHRAFQGYLQKWGTKSTSCGQTNMEAQ